MAKKLDIKHMLVHANRLFILDTNNRLWWSAEGDFTFWCTKANEEQPNDSKDAGWWDIKDNVMSLSSDNNVLEIKTKHKTYFLSGTASKDFVIRQLEASEGYV